MLKQSGLADVEIDAEGNVMGVRKGRATGPLIAIAAHLDTVFPEGTNVKVRREGTTTVAPGVGDDSRALAVLLAIIRAMDAAKIQTASDILFIGNVGEEGPGDLAGMKYLFQKGPYKDKIKMFISLDPFGWGNDITIAGMGSKRFQSDFQRAGRTQLWLVRARESRLRVGQCDRQAVENAGALQTRRRRSTSASSAAALR